MDKILFLFFFFLPAGLANSAPVLALKVPGLKKLSYPIDFNLKLKGERILGDHKTIRGFVLAILTGITVVAIQKHLYMNWEQLREISEIDYGGISSIILGSLLGFGAVFGDAFKSFFKRRIGIKPGGPWIPFDQVDFIIGGSLFSSVYIPLAFTDYLILFVVFIILHFTTNVVAYALKLKDVPY